MSYKIESITSTIPVSGQSYTDLRPCISADSIEDYREALVEVGRLAGNDAFTQRMSRKSAGEVQLEKVCTNDGCLYFNPATHTYEDEDGNVFTSGSVWASKFEKPFEAEKIAPKVAEKRLTTADKIIEGWNLKGEVSCDYGTAVHKAVQCAVEYGEMPNNPHLLALAQDAVDILKDAETVSEQFICSFEEKLCGRVDLLINKGNKHIIIVDFKTTDLEKRADLTPEAKELWNLPNKILSIYQLQLSFYAHILTKMGYHVDGLEVWAENAEAWKIVKLPVLDVTKGL